MANVLVTGGAGFIGSNFIRHWSSVYPQDTILNLDRLTYAASRVNQDFKNSRIRFVKGDIGNRRTVSALMKKVDTVFHFAAETHVDRSIHDSQIFLKTNVLGTQNLLESARQEKVKKFIYISTDEVYGSIEKGSFKETSPLAPNSPYAASKAAGDLLCRSYWVTHKMPVIITRCCNNFGPFQFPEKVVPLFITNLLEHKKIPVYGRGQNVREWIHVLDHCRAIQRVFERGQIGEVYNIGSGVETQNIALAKKLIRILEQSDASIQYVQDRPGHDLRYSLDSSKIRQLGWKPEKSFDESLKETVRWYQDYPSWWQKIRTRTAYRKYIKKQYTH